MSLRLLIVGTMILAGCASPQNTPEPEVVQQKAAEPESTEISPESFALEQGKAATQMFYAGELDALHARFSPAMSGAISAEQWPYLHSQMLTALGAETQVQRETTAQVLDNFVYRRYVTYQNVPSELVVTWAFLRDGTITGFSISGVRSPAETPHLDYKTKTALRVPFDGEWTVIWGGRTVEENYHSAHVGQRFAIDLVMTDETGRSFTGDGKKNEDYYAFGKPVLSPGKGRVIAIENAVEDNSPGQMNPEQLAGNFVLIDHENGEYSLLAHFQKGSLKVGVGDEVESGQLLGLCGNSGNSSEAHIHYHLQNSKVPLEGEGLPIFFEAVAIDGEVVRSAEIRQGQKVSPKAL